MRGCCERVTVWRRAGYQNKFEREVLPVLCNWRRKSERRLGSAAGFTEKNAVTVIIPYIPEFMLAPGDLIALGRHECEITGEKPMRECDIKAKLGVKIITVQSISYNLHGCAEHLRVEGI